MMHSSFFAALIILATAVSSQATVTIESTSVPTPGLAGFNSWTVRAVSTDPVTAIDFVGDGNNDPATGKGFFGPLNQLTAAGQPTPWTDFVSFLPIPDRSMQDSHFLVNSSQVVIPAGLVEENANLLQGAWAWSTSPGSSVAFAQLVIPIGETVGYRGTVTANVGGVQTDFDVLGCGGPVCAPLPVPPLVVDVNLDERLPGSFIFHQFTASFGDSAARESMC